ncbi:MAG: helix-turn-helix transcriptional regulator [Alphaproteobacteria bacterium]|nr:helix-turn-helix transcriptional regulator [Alphaproteobacteria bacterium]
MMTHLRLKEARETAGYKSAADFANKCGFTEGTYRSHENGTRNLTESAAKRYAKELNSSWLHLLYGDEAEEHSYGLAETIEIFQAKAKTAEEKQEHEELLAQLYPGDHPNAHIWIVNSDSLALRGVLPGSMAVVDIDIKNPKEGDLVCAQITNLKTEAVETVMRAYYPPNIVPASTNIAKNIPEMVDNNRVIIMGKIVAIYTKLH